MTPRRPSHTAAVAALTPGRMALFATATGALIANLYYAQPLLAAIGASVGRPASAVGLLVTAAQLGYALGVLLIAPLGDGMDRRRLLSILLVLCAASLLLVAASPGFAMLAAANLALGVASSAIMVLNPYVASHADDAERGRRVGQLMTGLLLGILLARTVSGLLAAWLGWRAVYVLAALAVAGLALALRAAMQPDPVRPALAYRQLLQSLPGLWRAHPELRRRALYTLLGMGSFGALWNGLTLLLSAPPYGYSTRSIGLFGLLGAAGALAANLAGRLVDRGWGERLTGAFAALLLASWGLLALARGSLAGLVAGIFVLDVAAQGLQVVHQSRVYGLAPAARARLNALYITAAFIGMALGSALASAGYDWHGWAGVCWVGAALPALLVLHWGAHAVAAKRHDKPTA